MSVAPLIQVVVAYDFSPSAEDALQRAVEVACRAPQHVLHVLAAIDARNGLSILATPKVDYDYAEKIQGLLAEHVKEAFAGRPAVSEVQFFVHARIGKPAEEILELAREVSADLVFVGSHGAKGFERLVLGSVSERIVREAHCPVMVVRTKTYQPVDLMKVIRYDHDRKAYTPPHRFSYVDRQAITRPNDWPIS
ncbi:MAG: universal stress protein [Myxococcales bacterium]|nr:universal stress protein [Myxococcales bacterium]